MKPKKKVPTAAPVKPAMSNVDLARQELANPELANLARYTVNFASDPRFNDLDRKEGYFRGTAYDTRPFDWLGRPILRSAYTNLVVGSNAQPFFGSNNGRIPVSQRKPNAQYALGRIINNRFAAMLFGNRVFPHVQVPQSKSTEQWFNGIIKKSQLRLQMYYAALIGGSTGSVITTFKIIDGRFRIENLNTKWTTIIWSDFTDNEMEAFSICYPFSKAVYDAEAQQWRAKIFLYRRLVTANADIEFEPQEGVVTIQGAGVNVRPKDATEKLVINPERTSYHGLGFLPAQFIQNLPRPDQVDGDCSYEAALDMIDRINELLSAAHQAMQGNLDPTLVVKIAAEDYNKLMAMGGIINTGAQGEGVVVGEKGDAKFIEITCEGIKAAMDVAQQFRTYVLEMADCVVADPHKLTGAAQSAAAIMLLYAPMLDKTDVLRVQYGEQAFRKLLVKIAKAFHAVSKTSVDTDNGRVMRTVVAPIMAAHPVTGAFRKITPDPTIDYDDIDLMWGAYFPPTTADMFQAAEAAIMATGGKPVVTQAVAVRALATMFGDHNVDQSIAQLAKEQDDEQQQEMGMAKLGVAKASATATPPPKPKAKQSGLSQKSE